MRRSAWYVGIAPTQDGVGYPEVFQGGAAGTDYTRLGGWGGYDRVHGPYRTEREAERFARTLPRGGDVVD
jgi:hypothetical protein